MSSKNSLTLTSLYKFTYSHIYILSFKNSLTLTSCSCIQMQLKHYQSEFDIFQLRPTHNSQRFTDLLNFISHVIPCYKNDNKMLSTRSIPLDMMKLLETNGHNLHQEVRLKLYKSIIHLHNKEMIDIIKIIDLSFRLLVVQDKLLRTIICEFIINDIKKINKKKHNDQVNKSIQSLLYDLLTSTSSNNSTSLMSRKIIYIISELYRRKVWTDSRSVNIMATACKSQHSRVMIAAMNFFLGIEVKMNEVRGCC